MIAQYQYGILLGVNLERVEYVNIQSLAFIAVSASLLKIAAFDRGNSHDPRIWLL